MTNQLLVSLVNSILGESKQTARGNHAYVCPFHISNPPGKKNFEINFLENKKGENKWHCWGCDCSGKKLKTLFTKLKVSQDKFDELKKYVNVNSGEEYIAKEEQLELPKEFKLVTEGKGITYKHAYYYLKKRGITEDDIIKYNIGYCEWGVYKNMVIFPSYDGEGKLNYFTGRSFEEDPYIKYKNPSITRDIIPFEIFINWNLPIILCEGIPDAIAIKRNVIPLLGKNIQSELLKKLYQSSVEKIYIALDKDAQKQALKHCEMLMKEGKEVYFVELEGKDPSELGFKRFTNIIQQTLPLDYGKLMEYKLQRV